MRVSYKERWSVMRTRGQLWGTVACHEDQLPVMRTNVSSKWCMLMPCMSFWRVSLHSLQSFSMVSFQCYNGGRILSCQNWDLRNQHVSSQAECSDIWSACILLYVVFLSFHPIHGRIFVYSSGLPGKVDDQIIGGEFHVCPSRHSTVSHLNSALFHGICPAHFTSSLKLLFSPRPGLGAPLGSYLEVVLYKFHR